MSSAASITFVTAHPTTLSPLVRQLAARGVRVRRLTVLRTTLVDPRSLTREFEQLGRPSHIVVSSRAAIAAFVDPVLGLPGRDAGRFTFYPAGSATARSLRRRGWTDVRLRPPAGLRGIAAGLAADGVSIVAHPTSELGRGRLSTLVGRGGTRVVEILAYRSRPVARLSAPSGRALKESRVLVAASPSALSALARLLPTKALHRLRDRTTVIALGPTTKARAQALGFSTVQLPADAAEQGFTQTWMKALVEARLLSAGSPRRSSIARPPLAATTPIRRPAGAPRRKRRTAAPTRRTDVRATRRRTT